MDSDDDFQIEYSPMLKSSLTPARKLKRLKKANAASEDPTDSDCRPLMTEDISLNFGAGDSEEPDDLDLEESDGPRLSRSLNEPLDEVNKFAYTGLLGCESHTTEAKRSLDFDSVTGNIDGGSEDQSTGLVEKSEDLRVQKSDKKQHVEGVLQEEREAKKKRKKKSGESADKGENSNTTATVKRMSVKERRELRAESQRLLRETRHAAFNPTPVVQKPLSSVLEKIRQRKLELSRKYVTADKAPNSANSFGGDLLESEAKQHSFQEENKNFLETAEGVPVQRPADVSGRMDSMYTTGSSDDANQPISGPTLCKMEVFQDLQTSDKDEIQKEMPSSPPEEEVPKSILVMNLKLDVDAPPPDVLSDDEDSDKENINPQPNGFAGLSSSSTGHPVKDFVDDEAEEEDDSDHDLHFQDSEEEEDTDFEELNDMIATGFEEKPIDEERRNELHQKWLERQDAVGTEKILKKLKCRPEFEEPTLVENEENEEEGEGDGNEFEAAGDLPSSHIARMNIKEVRQMLPHMYTDKDVYISDDDESDMRLAQQYWFKKADEKATFLSPAEDEGSRDVFGLITKLNAKPETKKKTRLPAFLEIAHTGVNKNTSSKSFLGRGSKHGLASSKKHVSGTSRSFIFGRDDSNSNSLVMLAEETSDMIQREDKAVRTASAKFSSSQVNSSSQTSTAEISSGISLLDILRQSSMQSKRCSGSSISSETESVFAAFKLGRTLVKKPM